MQLAAAEASEVARSMDWVTVIRRQQLAAIEWARIDASARNVLAAVTPAPLRALTGLTGLTDADADGPVSRGSS